MKQQLFPSDEFSVVLRLYMPHWNEEAIRQETIRYCKEAGIRDILLFSDAQYLVWNQLSPEELEREYGVWCRSLKAFKEAGIRSVGMNCSLMQMQSKADHREHTNYDYWLTDADGTSLHNLPCPMDPKLNDFIDSFFSKVAASGVDYLYMDDDLRYMNNGRANGVGCFCPLHLAKFSELMGRQWSREELQQEILRDPELRRQWLRFNGERLEDLALRINKAAKKGNPDIRVGLMVPCVNGIALSGNDLLQTAKNIAGEDRILLRPCIGPYQDYNRKLVFAGLFHLEMIGKLFGAEAEYTPELESSPSTAVSKSATVMRLYMMQGALNRMNAPLFTAVGYCGDTPYLEPRYLQMLKETANFFKSVVKHAPEPSTRRGIGLLANPNSALNYDVPLQRISDMYFPACSIHDVIDSAGLPHTYEESPVTFICGIHADGLSDDKIRQLLAKGVFLDARAAEILVRRGFGALIGVEKIEQLPFAAGEICQHPEVFGSYTGSYMQPRVAAQGTIRRLYPADGAEAVTNFVDHDLQELYPAVIRYQNELGGRVAVLPYVISDLSDNVALYHLVCHQRQKMFHSLVDWMDDQLVPFRLADGAEIVTQHWKEANRTVLVLTNFAYDVFDSYELKTSLPLEKAFCIQDDGTERPLRWKDGVLSEQLKPFRPLMIVLEE